MEEISKLRNVIDEELDTSTGDFSEMRAMIEEKVNAMMKAISDQLDDAKVDEPIEDPVEEPEQQEKPQPASPPRESVEKKKSLSPLKRWSKENKQQRRESLSPQKKQLAAPTEPVKHASALRETLKEVQNENRSLLKQQK